MFPIHSNRQADAKSYTWRNKLHPNKDGGLAQCARARVVTCSIVNVVFGHICEPCIINSCVLRKQKAPYLKLRIVRSKSLNSCAKFTKNHTNYTLMMLPLQVPVVFDMKKLLLLEKCYCYHKATGQCWSPPSELKIQVFMKFPHPWPDERRT